MERVTDDMVRTWLAWARNFGEVVAWRVGSGSGRRFRVRLPAGITKDGAPFRPREGFLDITGHDGADVVPAELMLTAREALIFGMGCAVGRTAALAGECPAWRAEDWTPAERAAFVERREEARAADRADLEREALEREEARLRRAEAFRRRREQGGSSARAPDNPVIMRGVPKMKEMEMDTAAAAEAIRGGGRVKVTIGTGEEDPVLEVYADDGMVMSTAVAGWSAGAVEPVCTLDSNYLTEHLLADRELELIAPAPVWTLEAGEEVAGVFKRDDGALVVQISRNGGRSPLDIAAGETACREVCEFIETNGYGWRKA